MAVIRLPGKGKESGSVNLWQIDRIALEKHCLALTLYSRSSKLFALFKIKSTEKYNTQIKVTLCNNLTLFAVRFHRQLVLVPSSNSF